MELDEYTKKSNKKYTLEILDVLGDDIAKFSGDCESGQQ
jgi:hypothetical protein